MNGKFKPSHFLLWQTVVREEPNNTSKVVQYITAGELVEELDIVNGFSHILTETYKVGYVRDELLEWYYPVFGEYMHEIQVPDDQEIQDALNEKRAAQYINLKRVGYNKVNKNLCGEFCVAQMDKWKIIPFLESWKEDDKNAHKILSRDLTTGIDSLKSMLDTVGLHGLQVNYSYQYPLSISKIGEATYTHMV